jgi:hypothetical protein
MNHPGGVGVSQRIADVCGDGGGAVGIQGPVLADHAREIATGDMLHHDEVLALVLAVVEDVRDVGMRQRRYRACLAAKPLHESRITGERIPELLYGDRSPQAGVLGAPHRSHSSGGNPLPELIPAGEFDEPYHLLMARSATRMALAMGAATWPPIASEPQYWPLGFRSSRMR